MNTLPMSSGEGLQDKLARRIVARLSESTDNLPHDISQRLKVARVQALAKRKRMQVAAVGAVAVVGAGAAALHSGDSDGGLWTRLGSLLPLIALVVGMMLIGVMQEQHRAHELASIDTELLADELPPSAYMDAGFVQYLKTKRAAD